MIRMGKEIVNEPLQEIIVFISKIFHMKLLFTLLIALALLASGCKMFTTLRSTTYIEPGKSFVLGEGQHGTYNAEIKNEGSIPVTILSSLDGGANTLVCILEPRAAKSVKVAGNERVSFRNEGDQQAVIKIQLKGDANLSMSFKEEKQR